MRWRRARSTFVFACAFAAGLAAVHSAHAQAELELVSPSVRQAPPEAIELYQSARALYQAGRYEEAAEQLERALILDPGSPTLLFNLGRVYELSGNHSRAIRNYRSYLRVLPEGDDGERQRIEQAIRRLEGVVAAESSLVEDDRTQEPLYVSERGVADDAFWITLGIGVAVTVAAASLAIVTAVLDHEANDFVIGRDGDFAAREAHVETVHNTAVATDVLGAIGGATLVSAALLWVLRVRTVELHPSPRATLDIGSGGVSLRW